MINDNIVWQPHEGSQTDFISCPYFEVLYHGTRGPGKSDALLMSFINEVGKYGEAWQGIIFRRYERELSEIQSRSTKWFKQIYGSKVQFQKQKMMWEFSGGEKLYLRHLSRIEDYWRFHGHEYPFIGWEELTNWATPECYLQLMSCCRSSTLGVPKMVRATTNPYGIGHSWVKERFHLEGDYRETRIIDMGGDNNGGSAGDAEFKRVAIFGHLSENKTLMESSPNYASILIESSSNPEMTKAWLEGSWDIVSGGMFADVWDTNYNVVKRFEVPYSWRVNRSFDWGSSAPFSVGWWAESDGSDYITEEGETVSTIKGDIFRIYEWYGNDKRKVNVGLKMLTKDICAGILEVEQKLGLRQRVSPGPADSSIFDTADGRSTADDMAKCGIVWEKANKLPGSRKQGLVQMRELLKNAHGSKRESPGLFIFSNCSDFLRVVPVAPRADRDLDDIDGEYEDHIIDETRYRIHAVPRYINFGLNRGV